MIFDITECERAINYSFKDKSLLRQCFTFKSYTNEHGGVKDNERLEYFGDAILEFVVSEYLYKNFSGDEGELTERRKSLVSKQPLQAAVQRKGWYEKFAVVGNGVERNGGDKSISSLFECLVAGIYLDGGMECAKKFIYDNLLNAKKDAVKEKTAKTEKVQKIKDAKTILQEYVQKNKLGEIKYVDICKKGPDHAPEFFVECRINGKPYGKGNGRNKKEAQSKSAETAYNKISKTNKRGHRI